MFEWFVALTLLYLAFRAREENSTHYRWMGLVAGTVSYYYLAHVVGLAALLAFVPAWAWVVASAVAFWATPRLVQEVASRVPVVS